MIGGGEGSLTVSVADPDLRFYEGPSDEVFDADGKRVERSIYFADVDRQPFGGVRSAGDDPGLLGTGR